MTQEFKYFVTTQSEWNGEQWNTITRVHNSSVVETDDYNCNAGEYFTNEKPLEDDCEIFYDFTQTAS